MTKLGIIIIIIISNIPEHINIFLGVIRRNNLKIKKWWAHNSTNVQIIISTQDLNSTKALIWEVNIRHRISFKINLLSTNNNNNNNIRTKAWTMGKCNIQ